MFEVSFGPRERRFSLVLHVHKFDIVVDCYVSPLFLWRLSHFARNYVIVVPHVDAPRVRVKRPSQRCLLTYCTPDMLARAAPPFYVVRQPPDFQPVRQLPQHFFCVFCY